MTKNMFAALRQHIRALSHGFPPLGPWLFVLCVLLCAGTILIASQVRLETTTPPKDSSPLFQKTPEQFRLMLQEYASSTPSIQHTQTTLIDRGLSMPLLWNLFQVQKAALLLEQPAEKDFALIWQQKRSIIPTNTLLTWTLSRLFPGHSKGLLPDKTLFTNFITTKTKVFLEEKDGQTTIFLPIDPPSKLFLREHHDLYVLSSTTTPIEVGTFKKFGKMPDTNSLFEAVLDFLSFPY